MNEQFLQRYKRDLILKGFSPRTQETYFRNLDKFLIHTNTKPDKITSEIIKDYLHHLIHERKLSPSSLRHARCAISYFFSQTLNRPIEVANIPCLIKEKKLPTVFSVEEVFKIINAAANIKHRTMLMLVYSSGLRVSELVKLKVSNINRSTMRISIYQAKGHRDRYTILSSVCLKQLEIYWKTYHPVEWLFEGKKKNTPLSIRAVQHAHEKAKKKADILKPGGIHSLRHSFATHMLETGSGIFQLQKFLGHKHLKTTLVYAHISEENVIARSPLDIYAGKYLNGKANS